MTLFCPKFKYLNSEKNHLFGVIIVTYAAEWSPIQTCSTSDSNLVTNPFDDLWRNSVFMERFPNFHGTSTDFRLMLLIVLHRQGWWRDKYKYQKCTRWHLGEEWKALDFLPLFISIFRSLRTSPLPLARSFGRTYVVDYTSPCNNCIYHMATQTFFLKV